MDCGDNFNSINGTLFDTYMLPGNFLPLVSVLTFRSQSQFLLRVNFSHPRLHLRSLLFVALYLPGMGWFVPVICLSLPSRKDAPSQQGCFLSHSLLCSQGRGQCLAQTGLSNNSCRIITYNFKVFNFNLDMDRGH